jgi:anaphase-promoting complex subunit 4
MDLQFYSQDYLSLLTLNKQARTSLLIQVPLRDISVFDYQDNNTIHFLIDILSGTWPRPFQGISARRLAVSGPRKVAAILSENNRKIRLLETEAEPEDEDDDDEEEARLLDNMMDTTPSVNFSTEMSRSNLQEYY